MTTSNRRIGYLDATRVLAMLLVITLHSPLPLTDSKSNLLGAVSYVSAPCIGLFFMTSGALLLSTSQDMTSFIRKRLGKVAWPTLFWSLFYLAEQFLREGTDIPNALQHLLSIPFSAQGNGVLWFMYALVGLYLITPILSAWLKTATKRDVDFILLIWGVTLLYPLLSQFLSVNESKEGITYYMSGYAGYYLLGYQLHQHPIKWKISHLSFFLLFPIAVVAVIKSFSFDVDFYNLFWYLSIFVVSMAIFWFSFLQRIIQQPVAKWVVQISNYSFGIYLVHIFVMRRVVWEWEFISQYGSLFQIASTVLLTFLLSTLVVHLISYLPFSKYIIGYKR